MGLNNGSMLKSVKVGILVGGALALSACSFFKSAECGSSDTKELVVSIASDKINKIMGYSGYLGFTKEDIAAAAAQVALEVNSIRTIGGGKDAGGFICEGDLTAKLSPEQIEVASLPVTDGDPRRSLIGYNSFSGQGFDGKTLRARIGYRVQATDDGDKLYAEVSEVDDGFIDAYVKLVLQTVRNAKMKMSPVAQVAPATASVSQELAPPAAVSGVGPTSVELEPAPVSAVPVEIRPSFNCDKASTNAEKLICSDADLASLDVSLSAAYKQHLSSSADRAATKKEQVTWIKSLNTACSDVDCLKVEYQERIDILSAAGT